MKINEIYNCSGLVEYINEIGFLPLLHMGLDGWSAEEAVDEECRYVTLPDGGWEWPLWEWKGDIIRESRMRIRQVLRPESCLHKPRMVAGLLQLAPKCVSTSGGKQH